MDGSRRAVSPGATRGCVPASAPAFLLGAALAVACGASSTFVRLPTSRDAADPLACDDLERCFHVAVALGLTYQTVDGSGQALGEPLLVDQPLMFAERGFRMPLAPGARALRVSARCQPDTEVPLDGAFVVPRLTTPPARTAYLRQIATLETLLSEEMNDFPQNAQVQVVRAWPDAAGGCGRALVRITDMGGVRLAGMGPADTIRYVHRNLFLVDSGALVEARVGGPTLAEQATEQTQVRRRSAEEQEEDAADVLARELETGRCAAGRGARVRQALQATAAALAQVSGPGGEVERYRREHQEVLIVGPTGETSVPYRPIVAGRYDAIALGFSAVQVAARVRNETLGTAPSPLAASLDARGLEVGSTRLDARAGADFTLRLQGRGCAGLLLLRRE